jgi:hypothetical protein
MKHLQPEELKQLQELQEKSQKIVFELGEISLNEILLQRKKDEIKLSLNEMQDEEKTLKQFLISKYGDININIETGEF